MLSGALRLRSDSRLGLLRWRCLLGPIARRPVCSSTDANVRASVVGEQRATEDATLAIVQLEALDQILLIATTARNRRPGTRR